jgi:hypothetical protein
MSLGRYHSFNIIQDLVSSRYRSFEFLLRYPGMNGAFMLVKIDVFNHSRVGAMLRVSNSVRYQRSGWHSTFCCILCGYSSSGDQQTFEATSRMFF